MRPSGNSDQSSASQHNRLPVALLALVALVVCSLSLAASARADGPPFGSSLDRSQLIVTFKQTSGPAAVSSTIADAGATKVGTITHTASTIVAVPELGADAALAALRRDPDVASVRVDPVVQLTLTPNDPQFHYPFNPCAVQLGCWPYSELNLPTAWDTTTGSANVTVAVVDTGVVPSHEDLSGAVLPGWNFVAGNANAADDNGHGTEVAGMIAARGNNGLGVVGSCWSCKILPVKVLSASGSGYASAVANGITWATDHGANVINLSVGGAGGDPSETMALNYAVAHGVFVAIAAGNAYSSDPSTGTGGYPGYYAKSIAGAVSVGAVDESKVLYDFSNYGDWVEVGAPGCALTTSMTGGYTSMCGTSAAAPQVAGAAALALSYAPSLTPAELEQHLETSADASHPALREGPSSDISCGGPCTVYGLVDDHALLQSLAPPTATSLPTLSGPAQVGQTLSGTDAGFSGATPITLTHSWLRCDASGNSCASISGATGSSYTLANADLGATLRFQTTATNPYGSSSVNSAASGVIAAPPAPTLTGQLLTLQGTTAVGGTFSAAQPGAFYFTGPIDSYTYVWTRCAADGSACATVSGVTTSTYPLSLADQGSTIEERITATNISGAIAIDSALSGVVLPPPPAPGLSGMAFTLQGTVAVGSSLSASQASAAYFTGAVESYGYTWLRCDASGSGCTVIVTATASSYALTTADQGYTLMERITATNGGGSVSLDSTTSALLPVPPDPVVPPPSSGGGGGGGGGSSTVPPDLTLTLSASTDTVAVGGQVVYTVSVFSKNTGSAAGMHLIVTLPAGATLAGSTFTRGSGCVQTGPTVDCNLDFLSPPQSADLRVTVSFATAGSFTLPFAATTRDRDADPSNNQASATVTVTDPSRAATGQAPSSGPKLLARPAVDGTFMVGEKLTATTGHWQGKAIKYRYSWRRCTANGSRCFAWKSTTRNYLLVAADRGKRITFVVTATDATGSRQASSTATPVVLGPLKRH